MKLMKWYEKLHQELVEEWLLELDDNDPVDVVGEAVEQGVLRMPCLYEALKSALEAYNLDSLVDKLEYLEQ